MTSAPGEAAVAGAVQALHDQILVATEALHRYEYDANRYLRMKSASISWSGHADRLAVELRRLLGCVRACAAVVEGGAE
jgi:hypothetical protein